MRRRAIYKGALKPPIPTVLLRDGCFYKVAAVRKIVHRKEGGGPVVAYAVDAETPLLAVFAPAVYESAVSVVIQIQ